MKQRRCLIAAAVVVGLVGSGTVACSKRAAEPARVAAVPPRATHVEAGTTFTGTLRTPLSTLSSNNNDHFTITVDDDVLANDGSIAIARGAVLHGHVVKVERRKDPVTALDEGPRMEIAIDSVSTDRGDFGISAGVIDAAGYATVGLAKIDKAHDSIFTPPVGPKAAFGGGPRDYGGDDAQAPQYQLTIPTGTKLQLMITEPMVTF